MDFRNQFITFVGEPLKREGIPDQYQKFLPEFIVKDKSTYPYTYDPFILFFNEKAKQEATSSIYTDRLLHQDWDKHNRLCQKHFGTKGQYWNDRKPEDIEAFLCDWTEKKVTLIANIQYVNISSGFPVWRLDFCYE